MPTTATGEGTIKCGAGDHRHATAYQVLCCYVAAGLIDGAWPCGWLYEGPVPTGDPDEPYYRGIIECPAPARMRADGTGYECLAGHEHTYAEARQAAGWDYAEDDEEAERMSRYGVEPRTMRGQVWPR
jgi:hypothetical protein